MVGKVKFSTLELPPTIGHIRAITRLCARLKIKEALEETVSNRREARNLMYQLRGQLRGKVNK